MRITRLVSALVAIALVGVLTVLVSSPSEAVTRPVPINGIKHNGKFFIRGKVGVDLARKKISVERQAHPGAKWRKWKKVYVNKRGNYRIRVFRVPGSRATCYRVSIRPLFGYEKSRSRPKCIVRVG